MKLRSPLLMDFGGLLATALIRGWMGTLDYRAAYYDPLTDPALRHQPRQRIYIFWHEYILCPLYLRGHNNLAMLLSRHQDAEILSRIAAHMGFAFIRGSTNRGGVQAVRELLRAGRHQHLAITPDGPRGPRRKLAKGPIYLASKLGLPLVPLGFGYDRPWRVRRAWDQFAVPRPYSRACGIGGPEIFLPPDLDADGVEHYRVQIERVLEEITREAERWAESQTRRIGQRVVHPRPAEPLWPNARSGGRFVSCT